METGPPSQGDYIIGFIKANGDYSFPTFNLSHSQYVFIGVDPPAIGLSNSSWFLYITGYNQDIRPDSYGEINPVFLNAGTHRLEINANFAPTAAADATLSVKVSYTFQEASAALAMMRQFMTGESY